MTETVGAIGMSTLPRVCYLQSRYTSHERAGLAYQQALREAGVSVVRFPAEADVVIIHDEASHLPNYFRAFPELSDRYVINYAVWEATKLPPHRIACLGLVDEVWTCSKFCQDVFSTAHDRVFRVPHIVPAPSEPTVAAQEDLRALLKLDDAAFVFYAIATVFPRKNLTAAIEAFAALDIDAHFVVKTDAPLHQDLAKVERVINLHGKISGDLINALHARGDCFVSAHCGEGWGLGLSEALSLGNSIVATGFGGCMEFLSASNSYLADFKIGPLQVDERQRLGFTASDTSAEWAYVDTDMMRKHMRQTYAERTMTTERQRQAVVDAENFRPRVVGQIMARRLAAIDVGCHQPSPRSLLRAQGA